jgi:uncharacterized protein
VPEKSCLSAHHPINSQVDMKIRLSEIKEGSQQITAELQSTELLLDQENFLNPIEVELNIDKGSREISINGQVQATGQYECDRCLKQFQKLYQGRFQLIVSYTSPQARRDDDNHLVITPTTNEIDLSEFIHDALLLSLPMKFLCREDCRGLCAHCGADLNKDHCQCPADPIDTRWEPLKQLLIKNTEER